ncbi:MAG: tetratricopeptide repeat protein, partial [Acidobacteria bacterium]|nr:tetratricopeptide repeat protein [Acidobacteriota bacterium]MDW7984859.1 tetratricopeptide repeat protein [Acidobacteriota bacterium]
YGGDEELEALSQAAQDRMEAEPFLQSFMASGISLFQSGLYADALRQFEKVVAIDPMYPDVQDWVQRTREQLGPTPSSRPVSAGPVPPPSDPVRQLIQKGQTLFDQGRYHEAIQTWMDVFMYDLTNAEVQDLIQRAQQKIAQARAQSPVRVEEARAAFQAGQPERARQLLMQVLEADPHHEEARRLLEALEASGTSAPTPKESAAETYVEPLVVQALQAHREGRWEDAARLWQQVLQQDPENLGAQSKYSEALRQLRIEGQFHRLLEDARAFWIQKKPDSAVHALQKAHRLRPDSPEVRRLVEEWHLDPSVLEPPASGTVAKAVVQPSGPPFRWTLWVGLLGGLLVLAGGAFFFFFLRPSGKSALPDTRVGLAARPAASKVVPPPKPAVSPSPEPSPTVTPGPTPSPPASTVESALTPVELTPAMARRRDQLLNEGRQLYARGDWESAHAKLQEALRIDPHHPEVRQLSAEVAARIQEQNQAIAERMAVVEGYYRSFDFDGAVFVLNRLREEFPQRRDLLEFLKRTYYNAAVYYLRQYRCSLARERLDVISLLDPKESRFQEPYPLIRKCLKENGLASPEDREKVQQLPYPLPLKD